MSTRSSIIQPNVTVSFTSETLPSNLIGDLRPINHLNASSISQLFDLCSAILTSPTSAETEYDPIEDMFQSFMEKLNQSMEQPVKDRPLRLAISALLYVFNQSVKQSINPDCMLNDLITLGLSDEAAAELSRHWKRQYAALNQFVRDNAQSIQSPINQSTSQLIDFEWKFGVSAASNTVNELSKIWLQTAFTISQPAEQSDKQSIESSTEQTSEQAMQQRIKKIVTEMTLPQFYSFLHAMQNAAREADALHQ